MPKEIKIEKKASEVIQPKSEEQAREAIRTQKDLSGARMRNLQLDNLNASGAILRKTDLTGADLSHGLLVNPNFYRASLQGASVNNTVFLGGDLVKTDFKDSDLSDSALFGVDAESANFEGANLCNAALVNAKLQDANFHQANLANARLASLDVTGANFSEADLTGAHAYRIGWSKAKVPPPTLPEPFVKLPRWAWSILIGGLFGTLALLIYGLARKNNKSNRKETS